MRGKALVATRQLGRVLILEVLAWSGRLWRVHSSGPHICDGMALALGDSRVPIVYVPRFREYGLVIDSGPVLQIIEHCPWCGGKLPDSLRDTFFDQLESMGLEPESADLPLDFRSDAWWKLRSPSKRSARQSL